MTDTRSHPEMPADAVPDLSHGEDRVVTVATYNVHRWTGLTGGARWFPRLATSVLQELDADVIALQEVLRPHDEDDIVLRVSRDLGLNLAFVPTRVHRRGILGNAILSRQPMNAVFTIDLSYGMLEQRGAVVTQFGGEGDSFTVAATHLALVDRTRRYQVRSLLSHPWLQGPTILLGDMNAWRRCRATRELDHALADRHNNLKWPPTYPAARPVLSLDRIYARRAQVLDLHVHDTPAARRGSDHLPIVAKVLLHGEESA